MPPCQPVKPVPRLDGGAQPGDLIALDLDIVTRLHDQVGRRHGAGVGVDGRGLLDLHVEAVLAQEGRNRSVASTG